MVVIFIFAPMLWLSRAKLASRGHCTRRFGYWLVAMLMQFADCWLRLCPDSRRALHAQNWIRWTLNNGTTAEMLRKLIDFISLLR